MSGGGHTNLCCVVGGTKDQLRGPVVTGANVRDVGLVLNQDLSGPEIAEFQDARFRVKQKILRFNVTVTDALRMNVCKRTEELINVKFDFQHWHGGLHLVEVAGCPVNGLWDKFKDEVQVHFIFL